MAPGWLDTELTQTHGRLYSAEFRETLEKRSPAGIATVDLVVDEIAFLLPPQARYMPGESLRVERGYAVTDGLERLALSGGGGFLTEIAEVARLSGDLADSTHSVQPSAQVWRYCGYLDELLADWVEIDHWRRRWVAADRPAITVHDRSIAGVDADSIPCPLLVSRRACLQGGDGSGGFVYRASGDC